MSFKEFAEKLEERVKFMLSRSGEVYLVDINKKDIWKHYQETFPLGTNEIYKQRPEHDCNTCRRFFARMAGLVYIDRRNYSIKTIWEIPDLPEPYATVAESLDEFVRELGNIRSTFRISKDLCSVRERRFYVGQECSRQVLEGGSILRWNHFHAEIPRKYVYSTGNPITDSGKRFASLKKAVEEVSPETVEMALSKISSGEVYLGDQKKGILESFLRVLNSAFSSKDNFLWDNVNKSVAHIRTDVIFQLLKETEAVGWESAKRKYESMVDPRSYQRSTSQATQTQAVRAQNALEELGLLGHIQRVHATVRDVDVNSIVWMDGTLRNVLKGNSLLDILAGDLKPPTTKKGQEITREEFFNDVIPGAESISVLLKNPLGKNFVSITNGEPGLFSWDSGLAWSYSGGVTDSIAARVKKRGGALSGRLRVSLAWDYRCDLDLHCHAGGEHIYYGNKRGILDVDANAGSIVPDPVENMNFKTLGRNKSYEFKVRNYSQRDPLAKGFRVEIARPGEKSTYLMYPPRVKNGEFVQVVDICTNGRGEIEKIKVNANMVVGDQESSTEKWGLAYGHWHKVNTIFLSPNHWGENAHGNKHWFFLIQDCLNPDPVRGMYSEFLKAGLKVHRKIFEALGERTKIEFEKEQLAGLGFSSTRRAEATFVVKKGKQQRTVTVQF